jgi:hypothetical protein
MIDPLLRPVSLAALRPTQMTVGRREVEAKRKHWREQVAGVEGKGAESKGAEFLGAHMIPAVLGPKGHLYVVDHHHLALALLEEGVVHVLVSTLADLSHLEKDAFWFVMAHKTWMHAYDEKGRPRTWKDLPGRLEQLVDDPYRSLAGELRRVGGYAKDMSLYSEFLWADYLRRHIPRSVVRRNFDDALEQALDLARKDQAQYLPGWCSR